MKNGFHVAVLDSIAQLGGAEISLLELIRNLNGSPSVTLILPEDGPLRVRAAEAGAKVRILSWPERLMRFGERSRISGVAGLLSAATAVPSLARGLAALLREIKADVLVTNGIKAHVLGSVAQKAADVPLVWYLREGLEDRRLSTLLLRLSASRCAKAVAISQYVARESKKVLPTRVPVRVLYNIVDLEAFRPGLCAPPDLCKVEGEVWFGVVGAVTPLKGQDIFLQAAEKVAADLPNARFLIVGTNFYRSEAALKFDEALRRQVEKAGLRDRVMFLGFREDIPNIFSVLDVLVQPNRGPEGLGRSVLEALACAVPVIAVNRWGPAELLQNSWAGLLFPWMDAEALAEKMILLGKDLELRTRLGRDGRNWILNHLSPGALASEFREFIGNGVISNNGA